MAFIVTVLRIASGPVVFAMFTIEFVKLVGDPQVPPVQVTCELEMGPPFWAPPWVAVKALGHQA